jgi:hypothetical protein
MRAGGILACILAFVIGWAVDSRGEESAAEDSTEATAWACETVYGYSSDKTNSCLKTNQQNDGTGTSAVYAKRSHKKHKLKCRKRRKSRRRRVASLRNASYAEVSVDGADEPRPFEMACDTAHGTDNSAYSKCISVHKSDELFGYSKVSKKRKKRTKCRRKSRKGKKRISKAYAADDEGTEETAGMDSYESACKTVGGRDGEKVYRCLAQYYQEADEEDGEDQPAVSDKRDGRK